MAKPFVPPAGAFRIPGMGLPSAVLAPAPTPGGPGPNVAPSPSPNSSANAPASMPPTHQPPPPPTEVKDKRALVAGSLSRALVNANKGAPSAANNSATTTPPAAEAPAPPTRGSKPPSTQLQNPILPAATITPSSGPTSVGTDRSGVILPNRPKPPGGKALPILATMPSNEDLPLASRRKIAPIQGKIVAAHAARMTSLAFRQGCSPMFLTGVEMGRKAVVKENNCEFTEALQLYKEALQAFDQVTDVQLQGTLEPKRKEYAARIKELQDKLTALEDKPEEPPAPVLDDEPAEPTPTENVDLENLPESPFPEKNKIFHELFNQSDGILPSEPLLSYFSCGIVDGELSANVGKIYITKDHICYCSSFSPQIKKIIKFNEIQFMDKKMLRVEVKTHKGDCTMFKGMVSVGSCYNLLQSLLMSCRAVYGVPLKDLLKKEGRLDTGIPIAIDALVESLNLDDSLETEGLFRISASLPEVEALANAIDRGNPNFAREEVHVKACALKMFFRKLPEPLLTFKLYDNFLAICDIQEPENQIKATQNVIQKLPPENAKLFLYLLNFLNRASFHSPSSKMTAENLAIVFGPITLRSSDPDFDKVLKESIVVNDVIAFCIQNYCQIAASP